MIATRKVDAEAEKDAEKDAEDAPLPETESVLTIEEAEPAVERRSKRMAVVLETGVLIRKTRRKWKARLSTETSRKKSQLLLSLPREKPRK
jgi:hypothetical protein